jgi:uncharacterized membrane protein YheB (UPF0754 family)
MYEPLLTDATLTPFALSGDTLSVVALVAMSLLEFAAAVTSPNLAGLLPSTIDWSLVLIPPITGIIGYCTNWVGIRLLFHPVEFHGFEVPGLKQIINLCPPRIQQIPGLMEGKVGWQGIVPSRAEKMGSIAATSGISMIASGREFYETFDPDAMAEHVVAAASDDIHRIVEEIIREEHPQLWRDAPESVRSLVHARVDDRLPAVADRLFVKIGDNIDELLDMQTMMIDKLGNDPELLNRMFLEIGDKELKFLVNSGFYIGTFLGCFSIPLYVFIDQWWVLPVAGTFVGYFTNFIAIKAIFNPKQPVKIGPFELQGLFIKRQDEASVTYADIVSREIVTIGNLADNMLNGRKGDRTRKMIKDSLRPAVDEAVGVAAPLVRITTGEREYEAMRERFADETIEYALDPLQDEEFNRERSEAVRELIIERMRKLPPEDYCLMLRSAFKEDEWLLISIGGLLGFVAGWIQLLVVTAV